MPEKPILILAADPPSRDDTEAAQQDKAEAVAKEFAAQHGGVFGGVLANKHSTASRARKSSAAGRGE